MTRSTEVETFPWLDEDDYFEFPDPSRATPDGVIGVGGNLSPGMLLSAYRQGVFPWFSHGDPILWWCPDPRFVVPLDGVHLSRSMTKRLHRRAFGLSVDRAFDTVIDLCAHTPRQGQRGTWITESMKSAYQTLHKLGFAHSCEAWLGDRLVGGLYGVAVGRIFFGESMFSHEADASKYAFHALAAFLRSRDFILMDSQVHNPHVASLGGIDISRDAFLERVRHDTRLPSLERWADHFESESVVEAAIAYKLAQD